MNLDQLFYNLSCSETKQDAVIVLELLIKKYGIKQYAFAQVGRDGKANIFSNYPQEWLDYYNSKKLYMVDPVLQNNIRKPSIAWSSQESEHPIFKKSREYNIHKGITLSYANNSGTSFLTLLDNTADGPVSEHLHKHESLINMFFSAVIARFNTLEEKYKVVICLTDREKEILRWSILGKTANEIAGFLGISARTVHFHWNNIYEKLEVDNKLAAILFCIRNKVL